jgi:hypothetical protein
MAADSLRSNRSGWSSGRPFGKGMVVVAIEGAARGSRLHLAAR